MKLFALSFLLLVGYGCGNTPLNNSEIGSNLSNASRPLRDAGHGICLLLNHLDTDAKGKPIPQVVIDIQMETYKDALREQYPDSKIVELVAPTKDEVQTFIADAKGQGGLDCLVILSHGDRQMLFEAESVGGDTIFLTKEGIAEYFGDMHNIFNLGATISFSGCRVLSGENPKEAIIDMAEGFGLRTGSLYANSTYGVNESLAMGYQTRAEQVTRFFAFWLANMLLDHGFVLEAENWRYEVFFTKNRY